MSSTPAAESYRPLSVGAYLAARSAGAGWVTAFVSQWLGALLAPTLVRLGFSPNGISVIGAGAHLAPLAVLVSPIAPPAWVLGVAFGAVWHLGYALDCADGQVARAHRVASPLGAWLDQILDFTNHSAIVVVALSLALRESTISPASAAVLGALIVSGRLYYLFASSQKGSLIGSSPAIPEGVKSRAGRAAKILKNINDHALYISFSAIAIPFPQGQLFIQAIFSLVSVAAVGGLLWAITRRW